MTSELSAIELQSILAFTVSLAREAGGLILEGSSALAAAAAAAVQDTPHVGEKKNSVDLVTEYDVRVEEFVQREIASIYPDFKFIGEESFAAGKTPSLTDDPTFCVDPIDGTTNFIHGFPFACISIGLIHKRRPVLGVIYNPFLDHLYTGIRGQGSYLKRGSGQPVKLPLVPPRALSSLSQALIAVEWGSDRSLSSITKKASSFVRLAGDPKQGVEHGHMAHSLRSLGTAALNLAMVAQGGMDVYWEIGCWPWDVCAGIVIVQESGGVVTGSHTAFATSSSDDGTFGDITEDILFGRKFIAVRAIADTPTETGREAQKKIVKQIYEAVEDAEPE